MINKPKQNKSRVSRVEARTAYSLVTPTLIVLLAVIGYPVVRAIVRSFYSDPIAATPEFIGFGNYSNVLFGDLSESFWEATSNTLFFTVTTVILEVIIGMAMALVMNLGFRGRGIVRAAILVPWAIPTAVVAVMWRWVFNVDGIANHLIGKQILWTGAEWPAKSAIIMADVWKTAPFIALLTLAGLQAISTEVYEAAKVDGAGPIRRFFSITLPLVRPALVVAVLFRMLDALRMYDLPQILTHGANNTNTLSMLVVRQSIGALKAGQGSALSTLTFIIIFVIAFLYIRLLGADVMAGRDGRTS
ncbi:sugar ABC transporter permease [Actinomycetaceae bacterium WB03_NA08]|uniref:Sugar ABC transporter permease n=1 Tax=Scrofimicrobium canadense TaxID=2652290 RepID=A0A6N7WAE8_9ACTO|nr:sugar ABC transporter permease [Scrofimicrobium canadense]MSS85422.1 sugar ABC transporter permease [Scrofimicrobium canadense]